jgi:transglutaminase-like putative cysteine protease
MKGIFTLRSLLLPLLALAFEGRGQVVPALADIQKEYPGQQATYLDLRTDLTIEIRHDSVQVLARHHHDMLHLGEESAGYAYDQVYSSHFSRLQKLEARTMALVPGTTDKYKALKVTTFKNKADVQDGIFFDDTRTTSFSFPAIAPGARTITDYSVLHPDARFLLPFYFGSYVPVRHSELTITAPKSVVINYKMFNAGKLPIKFSKQEQGSSVVYRWTADNLPAATRDADAPKGSYYLPHLVYYVEQATIAGKQQQLLSGVPQLYTLYSDFVRRIQPHDSPALKQQVETLVAGAKTPEEKARRVYYWVQDNVRYIAFEQGLRGFVPHAAGLVYERRYGDCKDMANLTTEMLRLAGLKSYLTWVGTRDLPYKYEELATPGVDNHMISTCELTPGQYVFLDATGKYTPFGMPSAFIQGKEGLLALDATQSKVLPIPTVAPARNGTDDRSVLTFDGATGLHGTGQVEMNGYAKVDQTYAFDGLDKVQEPKYVKALLERGNNKFFVDKYAVQNLAARDQPLRVTYDYRVQDYVQKLDDELYVNLNLEKPLAHDRLDSLVRRLPRMSEFAHTDHTRTELVVPAGYEVSYLPLKFTISYERQGDRIIQDRELTVNYLLLPPGQFGQWNGVVDKLGAAYREVVILKKKKT